MAKFEKEKIFSIHYLRKNPNHIVIYGDNSVKFGKKGSAILRDEPNTHGFVTKKYPNYKKESYYKPKEYKPIFDKEVDKLKKKIESNPDKTFLITKIGSGLANKYNIYENIIKDELPKELEHYDNVIFVWE